MWAQDDDWEQVCRRFRGWAFLGSQPVIHAPESQLLVLRNQLLPGGLLRRDEVQIDALRGVLQLRWGLRGFEQVVEVPLVGLQLILLARRGSSLGEFAVELRHGPERLLLVESSNLPAVRAVYEQLGPFFPGAASDQSGLVQQRDSLLQVCHAFRDRAYFGFWPVVRSPESQRLVARNTRRWWIALLILGLGSCLLLALFFARQHWDYWFEKFALHVYIGVSVLIAWAVIAMLHREELRIDMLRGVVQFRWGRWPWTKQVEVPLQGLELVLLRNQQGDGYALEIQRGPNRLRLVKWTEAQPLQPVYEQLALYFPGAASNRTVIPRPFPAQVSQEAPIRIRHQLQRDRTHYLKLQGNRAELRGAFGGTLGLVMIALAIPIFSWWLISTYPPATGFPTSISVTVWGLSAFIAVIGWWIWPRTIVIEANGWLRVPSCQWEGRWRGALHASDIAAVQICDSPEAFQVNLVAKGPELCRVNLLCDIDPDRTEHVATELSRLLGVPLQTPWRSS
jgi:hypothetical protein